MCKPHCWQYAKPSGVCVPHRGHAIVLPWARGAGVAIPVAMSAGEIGDGDGGIEGGTVGSGGSLPLPGMPPSGPNAGTPPIGVPGNPPIGPDGMPDSGPPIGAPIGLGPGVGPGRLAGATNAGDPELV
jgi:hypothetical protein